MLLGQRGSGIWISKSRDRSTVIDICDMRITYILDPGSVSLAIYYLRRVLLVDPPQSFQVSHFPVVVLNRNTMPT